MNNGLKIGCMLAILGMLVGCAAPSQPVATNGDSEVAVVATETAVATMQPDTVQKVPRSQCTVCGGTGRVRAGDTVTVVWHDCENCYDDSAPGASACPCGAACTCGPDCQCGPDCRCPAAALDRRVLIFTANWCIPCQAMKGDLLPWAETQTRDAPLTKLLSTGWLVGETSDCHFQLVDIDDHPEMMERFNFDSIPLCISIVDGTEVKRHQGPMDQWELAELYNTPAPEPEPTEDPGAFVNLGELNDVQSKILQLRELLTLLGGRGSVELRPDDPGQVNLPVSPVASVRLTTPCTVHYVLDESGVITLRFDQPIPLRYRFLRGGITAVEISTDQVQVKIDGLPDGFFDVRS